MKLWKFELKRQENTMWDYIISWGLALIEMIPLTILYSYGYEEEVSVGGGLPAWERLLPSTYDWFLYSVEVILLFSLMASATIYLKREHRFIVFPLIMFLSSSLIQGQRIVHPSILPGLGYALGSLIITPHTPMMKVSWKRMGIYWGIVGFCYSLIIRVPPLKIVQEWTHSVSTIHDLSVLSLIPLGFLVISVVLINGLITSSSPAMEIIYMLFWTIFFALIGIAYARTHQT